MLNGITNENKKPDDTSASRTVMVFVLGAGLTFWLVLVTTHLLPLFGVIERGVPWDDVDGYFNWLIAAFVPAIVPYLVNKAFKNESNG